MTKKVTKKVTKKEQEAIDKLLGKKPFYVDADETVYYRKIVWAMDEAEVREMVMGGDVYMETEDIHTSDYFQITNVSEVE